MWMDLYEVLKSQKIVIYGAGFIADLFYQALVENSLSDHIIDVVTTTENDKLFHGFEIKKYSKEGIPSDALVCVAMHDVFRGELEGRLISDKINYIWFSKNNLTNLLEGYPEEVCELISVKDILEATKGEFRLAIRWLMIEEVLGNRKGGIDLNKKLWLNYLNAEVAEKRTDGFIELIKNIKANGFRRDCPIMIDRNCRLMDGSHRFMLACYLEEKNISCNIYKNMDKIRALNGEKALLTDRALERSVLFTEKEKQLIRDTDWMIRKKICAG